MSRYHLPLQFFLLLQLLDIDNSTTLFSPQYLLTDTQRDGTITSPQQLDTDRGLAYQRIIKAHQTTKARHHKTVKIRPIEEGA